MEKERIIFHIDINHCFAQIEEMLDPSLKDVPMCVGGDEEKRSGIVLARNLKAKEYGITTAETLRDAYRKCPHLRVVPAKYSEYIYYTSRVKDIYREYTNHVETCVLLSHKSADDFISVKMEYADDRKIQPDRITYRLIQEYIEEKYGFKVHTANIAEVKRNLGLPMYDAPNAVEELKRPYKPAPEYKVEAIKDALRHFKVID